MGTRAVILVTGSHWQGEAIPQTVRLHCHWAGGLEDTLPTLADGVRRGHRLVDRRRRWWPDRLYLPARTLADCITAASVQWDGFAVGLDTDDDVDHKEQGRPAVYTEPLGPRHLGEQADLEWAYVLDVPRRALYVYGGYGTAAQLLEHGPTDPAARVEDFYPEYQAKYRRRIRAAVRSLGRLGWSVNPAAVPVQRQSAAVKQA